MPQASLPRSTLRAPLFACAALLTLLAACGPAGAPGGPPGGGGPAAVSVVPVTQREVREFDEFTARLEAPDTVELRSRVAGTLEAVHFKEGQLVKKGDALFTIDRRTYAAEVARAEAQVAALRVQVALSKSELARAETLLPVQGVSQQEIDQLSAAVQSGQANVKAAEAGLVQARINLDYTRITAPVSGRTSRANVTPGNLVAVGDPVLTSIVSADKVYAYFDASEATYLKYVKAAREGTRTSSREKPNPVLLGLANEEGYPHQGAMDFVDNRLNPATGSIRGRAVFDNKAGLFTPGLFARLKLVGSGQYTATLVPNTAITTDQTRKVVLVVVEKNIVQPREVKTGALIDGMRVVQGLKAGELVIVDGLQRAFPGAPVQPTTLKTDAQGLPVFAPPPGAAPPSAPASAASK